MAKVRSFRRTDNWEYENIRRGGWRTAESYKFFEGDKLDVRGFDTETADGKCYLLTDSEGNSLYPTDLLSILDFLVANTTPTSFNFFWHIRYDIGAIFKWLSEERLKELYDTEMLVVGPYIVLATSKFLSIKVGRNTHVFTDLNKIYSSPLNVAATTYLGENKGAYDVLGMKKEEIVPSNTELRKYCEHDSVLTADLGKNFLTVAREEGVLPARIYSSASVAEALLMESGVGDDLYTARARIPYWMQRAGYDCYCGGWTELFQRGSFDHVHAYDINSAYPAAMIDLPDLNGGVCEQKKPPESGSIGWLNVTVKVEKGELPLFRVHVPHKHFSFYPTGTFRIWATSEELEGFDYKTHKGYWIRPGNPHTSFNNLVRKLYRKKSEVKGSDIFRYLYYKIALNSLYGKMIQVNPLRKNDKKKSLLHTHGGLFCPLWASLITARTRRQIWEAAREPYYRGELISISTDSIWTVKPVEGLLLSKELGDWELDQGKAIMVGNGQYQLEKDDGSTSVRKRSYTEPQTTKKGETITGLNYRAILEKEEGTKIRLPITEYITLFKVLYQKAHDVNDFNKLIPNSKILNINAVGGGRLWDDDFKSGQDLLLRTIQSRPLDISAIRYIPSSLEDDTEEPEDYSELYNMLGLDEGLFSKRFYYNHIRKHGKIYIRPGMDSYTELLEGMGKGRFSSIATKSSRGAQTLDEWASEFGLSANELSAELTTI